MDAYVRSNFYESTARSETRGAGIPYDLCQLILLFREETVTLAGNATGMDKDFLIRHGVFYTTDPVSVQ